MISNIDQWPGLRQSLILRGQDTLTISLDEMDAIDRNIEEKELLNGNEIEELHGTISDLEKEIWDKQEEITSLLIEIDRLKAAAATSPDREAKTAN